MADMSTPIKNTAFTLSFTLYKNDGTIVANPGTYTKKVSVDGGAVADIAAAVTEEDTTYGQLSLVLATGEMNGDFIWVYVTDDTAGTVPFTCSLYPAAGAPASAAALATVDSIIDNIHDTDLPAVKADTASLLKGRYNKNYTDPATGDETVFEDDSTTVHKSGAIYEDIAGTMPFDGSGANRRDRMT